MPSARRYLSSEHPLVRFDSFVERPISSVYPPIFFFIITTSNIKTMFANGSFAFALVRNQVMVVQGTLHLHFITLNVFSDDRFECSCSYSHQSRQIS